jgi:hypothetical protein
VVPTHAGTLKRVRVYGRAHDDVRRKMTKLPEQADQGIPIAAESWTVERYLMYWLDHVCSSPDSANRSSAAGTGGTRPATCRAAAPNQTKNAAAHGCPPAWFSSSTPY